MRPLDIIFIAIFLVIVVAVIGLFAMMGELGYRVADGNCTGYDADNDSVTKSDCKVDRSPVHWPNVLRDLSSYEQGLILILGASCRTCEQIAPHVASHATANDSTVPLDIVVSCRDQESGEHFLKVSSLDRAPHTFLDIGGTWTISELGVDYSPAVVRLERGIVKDAWVIRSMSSVGRVVDDIVRGSHQRESQFTEGTQST